MTFQDFATRMADPSHLLTHLPYALLVISMLMNDMSWLRAIAIVAHNHCGMAELPGRMVVLLVVLLSVCL